MELKGKVALVTGAGRRVGRAIAIALAERGATVAIHYNRSRAEAEASPPRSSARAAARRPFPRTSKASPRSSGW